MEDMKISKIVKMVVVGFLVITLSSIFLTNCYTVKTGEVAVISTFGKLDRIEYEGLHFKIPFIQSKDFMETREKTYIFGKTQEMDTTLEVSTKDM